MKWYNTSKVIFQIKQAKFNQRLCCAFWIEEAIIKAVSDTDTKKTGFCPAAVIYKARQMLFPKLTSAGRLSFPSTLYSVALCLSP